MSLSPLVFSRIKFLPSLWSVDAIRGTSAPIRIALSAKSNFFGSTGLFTSGVRLGVALGSTETFGTLGGIGALTADSFGPRGKIPIYMARIATIARAVALCQA